MITVRDLAQRLRHFANSSPENGQIEVMVVADEELALQFGKADTHTTMGPGARVAKFLVFYPDPKSPIKLQLKAKEIVNGPGTSYQG